MYGKQLFGVVCLFLMLGLTAAGQAAMDGLVGAWLFDEGSGTTATDSSGNGFDGTLVGNVTYEAQGKYGSALTFDGSEGYVEVADDPAFEFDGDFTIACWVWNEVPPSDHSAFVTKGYDKPGGEGGNAIPWYLVYFLKTGTVDMFLRAPGNVNSRASGVTPVNDGEWHYVVGLKEGDKVRIYVDGVMDGEADAVDAVYGENDQPLVFMVHFHRWMTGLLDEVAIFNRALSEGEIAQIMDGLAKNALAVSPQDKLATVWANVRTQ